MHIDKLSLSYKCHRAIGNSLDLITMMDEVLQTFLEETFAISATFYDSEFEVVCQHGKTIKYDVNTLLSQTEQNSLSLHGLNDDFNLILYRLQKGVIVFVYDSTIEIEFILSMYESFRSKLDISIDSCLNVQALKKSNHELQDLTQNLQQRVDEAIIQNKKKEKQLYEQLKMSQMGELIGNIAHQWRQPLSVISTVTSGLRLKKELNVLTDENFYEYMDSILNNVDFLSKTIDEFRDYIKESHREKEIIIQDRVKMAFAMIESSYKMENIEIIEEYMEEKPIQFRLVIGELLQVLLSILSNAKEAIVQNNPKKRYVKYGVYQDQYKVTITLEDSGGGIPETILDKIFNPYFTTKHKSQGTGIGLYTSYDIITNHLNGKLYVENTNEGAKFFIELPVFMNYVI